MRYKLFFTNKCKTAFLTYFARMGRVGRSLPASEARRIRQIQNGQQTPEGGPHRGLRLLKVIIYFRDTLFQTPLWDTLLS